MSTAGSAANLVQAARDLSNQWQQAKVYWHDVKSQEFERNYIEGLPIQVEHAVAAMEELENILRKVRSDCE